MMDSLVQSANVMSSSQRLQSSRHSMQMRLDSIPFEPCVIGFCACENFVSGRNIIHLPLHVHWHLSHDSTMLIERIRSAALQCFWNLLLHLYYSITSVQASPTTPAAEFAPIASCSREIAISLSPYLVWPHDYRHYVKFHPYPRC